MKFARLLSLILLLAITTGLATGCGGPKPTPTTGPDAPKAPGVPPGGP